MVSPVTLAVITREKAFFDEIATMKPEDWRPGSVDAIAARSADGEELAGVGVGEGGEELPTKSGDIHD